MTKRFVIVAEDELGARLTRDLCDRVVPERGTDWLRDLWEDEATRDQQRRYTGFTPGQRWSGWGDVKRLADQRGIRVHGIGMKGERLMAHKAVAVAAELNASAGNEPRIDVLFLVHDTDGDLEVGDRLREGARGRPGAKPPFAVLAATPHPESEAWVVAGAAPGSPGEQAKHAEERRRLGFDPVTQPERLSANRATDKRDSKRVCETLLGPHGDAYEAWEPCWRKAPLELLEQNGELAGLRAYTREVEEQILPLLGSDRPRSTSDR